MNAYSFIIHTNVNLLRMQLQHTAEFSPPQAPRQKFNFKHKSHFLQFKL